MASNQVTNQRRPNGKTQGPQGVRRDGNVNTDEGNAQGTMKEFAEHATEYLSHGREQMEECIRGREATAVVTAVAAGLGIGLVIGAALGRSHRKQLTWRDRITAEGFGRRLMERIESMIPDALSDHFSK